MAILKPPRLSAGDTIGIVSPSWGGAGAYPHRVKQGITQLEKMGFRVKIAPHALNQLGFVSDTPEHRASDLHALFTDPHINAIISAIGGDHSCHLLPLLNFELIAQHPKIFMGFSDITVLNMALWHKTGLCTFNGPAFLTDFAEHPHMFGYTEHYFVKAVCGTSPIGIIEPATHWAEEFLDWGAKKDLERPRKRETSAGWTWLKPGLAEGRLLGGCIESLQHLRGTPYAPSQTAWRGAIFFFETSEDKPSPATLDGMLMDYDNMGVLGQISGMLVGRPAYYTATEKIALNEVILERTKHYHFPIITNMDFGHTSPQFTLPIGCMARIDSDKRCFEILETAVT
jgi:muramoyltetrapeptide carboxypeptidase LdcA involved in peptidoglycan recycling